MSAIAAPWVKETSATSGTGTLTLTGKLEKYIRFNMGFSAGTSVWYSIEDANGNREAGIGTFNGTNQLTRDTIDATLVNGVFNSTNPTPINLSGTSIVSCTFNAAAYNELVLSVAESQSSISTGIFFGGVISINAIDNSKFDISAGKGVILDTSNPASPQVRTIEWENIESVTLTNLATSDSTLLALNSSGTVIQSVNSFSYVQSRSLILLGGVSHPDNATISTTYSLKMPSYNVGASLRDLVKALGLINEDGNVFSANGANLQINRSGGVVFAYGQNFDINPNDPNHVSTSLSQGENFLRVHGNGSGNLVVENFINSVDPDNYDNGGVLTAVPTNRWTNIRLYVYPNTGTNVVRYGSAHYATKTDALNALLTESVESLVELGTAVLRGFLTVKEGATELDNGTVATFTANNGNIGGGSGTPSTGLTALVDDPNPQLGGNLDTNSYTISFTSSSGLTSTDLAAAIDETNTNSLKSNQLGQANGVASLDSGGKVPSAQLPSYVDDVVESATYAALPVTGETGKIYLVITDETQNNKTTSYRWTGSVYALIDSNLTALDVKTLYESNSDTNAFTDAEKAQLAGLGTASTKDVGEASGNVMQVGAFGLGGASRAHTDWFSLTGQNNGNRFIYSFVGANNPSVASRIFGNNVSSPMGITLRTTSVNNWLGFIGKSYEANRWFGLHIDNVVAPTSENWVEFHTTDSLNLNEFGFVTNGFIAEGIAFNTATALFHIPIFSYTQPASITLTGTFSLIALGGTVILSNIQPADLVMSTASSGKLLRLQLNNQSGLIADKTYILRAESAASGIKVNF